MGCKVVQAKYGVVAGIPETLSRIRGSFLWRALTKNHYEICFGEVDWKCLFGIIIWRIHKNSNLFIFQGATWSNNDTIKVSYCWAKQFLMSDNRPMGMFWASIFCSNSFRNGIYLNTDGSVKLEDGFAVAGEVVKN
ncbi:hypothetical protein PVK06_016567 [Gossypium arboreum]|uniref:Uncharacterized protein n=1 Tax=Gossypium arboreum TaxID=29729 RepID=A0ABR0Q0A8_GOSAR|nr:hypothetical protein PVK06_016567 [Gossypium arboreum]